MLGIKLNGKKKEAYEAHDDTATAVVKVIARR